MGDLSRSVIDLAISTIKKTHHGVTIASVTDRFQADKEVCNIRVTFNIENLKITTIYHNLCIFLDIFIVEVHKRLNLSLYSKNK